MTEYGLISEHSLRRENLNPADYTQTLTAEALRAGIFTEDDVERIRGDLMNVLAEVIGYATRGESSSVRTDAARQYGKSLLYNIDTYLLTLPSPEEAAQALKERRMSELHGKGYLVNKKHWEDAKHLWGRVRYTRLKTADEAYNKTLDVYFRNYLTAYDPRISAHDKIYLSLPKYGIRGAFHIDSAVKVLEKLLTIHSGGASDVVIPGSQPIGVVFHRKSEQQSSAPSSSQAEDPQPPTGSEP